MKENKHDEQGVEKPNSKSARPGKISFTLLCFGGWGVVAFLALIVSRLRGGYSFIDGWSIIMAGLIWLPISLVVQGLFGFKGYNRKKFHTVIGIIVTLLILGSCSGLAAAVSLIQ